MDLLFSGFDWDDGNRLKNLRKHGVSHREAEEVFFHSPFIYPDKKHSTTTERRFVAFGTTKAGKALFIAFTARDRKIRVISARPMSRKERIWYDQAKTQSRR